VVRTTYVEVVISLYFSDFLAKAKSGSKDSDVRSFARKYQKKMQGIDTKVEMLFYLKIYGDMKDVAKANKAWIAYEGAEAME
jgi:hypothetical protein